jgi:serine/threonine-protein kinase RsbW
VLTYRDTLWAAQNRHAWRDFEAMGAPLHIEMTLTSRVDLANLVHAASDEICRLAGIDEDSMLNLGLALREATVNAMKHGNKLVSERPVTIIFDLKGNRLEIAIHDQGEGFDFKRDVDPRLPENIEKTNGRGMFLIRNFVDDVRYTHTPGGGTTVHLVKKIPRGAGRRASHR